MSKKLYTFQSQDTMQRFDAIVDENGANRIAAVLCRETNTFWRMYNNEDGTKKYNEIVQSTEYKHNVEQANKIYAGVNFTLYLNRLHQNYGILPLGNRELYKTIDI